MDWFGALPTRTITEKEIETLHHMKSKIMLPTYQVTHELSKHIIEPENTCLIWTGSESPP